MAKRSRSLEPWTLNDGRISFAFHEDGTLSLRKAGVSEDASSSFDPSQQSELADMLEEMKVIGRPVRTSSLWLRSKEKDSEGRFIGIDGAIMGKPYEKDGEEVIRPYAYTVNQVRDFTALAFAVKRRWTGYTVAPTLQCYAEANSNAARAGSFTRSVNTAAKETPASPAAPAQYKRQVRS